MRRGLLVYLLLLLATGAASARVESGLWYDRAHDGHGLDLHRGSGQLFGAFYTFDERNAVQWLWLQAADADAPASALTRYRRTPAGVAGTVAGQIRLTPVAACPDGQPRPGARALLRMDFTLDGRDASWCVEPLLPLPPDPHALLSGAWYDPADPGWGVMSHYFRGGDGASRVFRTVYFHDSAGAPRWAFAQDTVDGLRQAQTYYTPYVECIDCAIAPILTTPIGSGTTRLTQPLAQADAARNRIELALRFDSGAPFARNTALALISEPLRVAGAAATAQGPLAGSVIDGGIESFVAIPYVAPPLGALRWRAPQAPALRERLLEARAIGPGCPQPAGQGFFSGAAARHDEDCLQLNVWRPATPGPHPVMVWIHGGGLTQGSAVQLQNGVLLYDGAVYARRDVVFVSINYRLGPLGFLAQRDLRGEAPDHPQSGNYGLLDQVAALAWVRANIAAFGGDPQRVTVYGESAGGVSSCALLATPAASGLFQRAIVQSGNCLWNAPSLDAGIEQGDRVTLAAGCVTAPDRRACLRALSVAALFAAGPPVISTGASTAPGEVYGLVVDGYVLPESPGPAIAGGRAAPLPLLIGVNDDEHATLAPAASLPATAAGYEAAVRSRFGLIGGEVVARYPAAAYPTPALAYQDLLDDARFTCAARRAGADHAARGNAVYQYVLTEILPDAGLVALESFHALDVLLLFGPRAQAQAPERTLAARMQRVWVDFAYGREPGSSDAIAWPRYRADARQALEFNSARSGLIDDYRREYCAFWNRYAIL
ncbi:MAG TPA: carboxylesterase family protein [Pseudomonadota bacterium]|nr:carboxylesterase family protein [Pseudomonadota bacterium]